MKQAIPLSSLEVGSKCRIVDIELEGLMRRRILDLGIVPGTIIRCVRKSPAGDPTAYLVRDTLIALRSEDTSRILVNSFELLFEEGHKSEISRTSENAS